MFDKATDLIQAKLGIAGRTIRAAVLGTNNERLDFIMDSFYKLTPQQRNGVLGGIIGVIVGFVLVALWLYFSQIGALKQELNNSFMALHELHILQTEYEKEKKSFDKLIGSIGRKTRTLSVKPFFEKISNQENVTIEGLTEQTAPFPPESPFNNEMQRIKVDMNFPKISIPRLLNFLVEVEKSNNFLTVEDLQIRARYGTKLFFSASAKVRGYRVTK